MTNRLRTTTLEEGAYFQCFATTLCYSGEFILPQAGLGAAVSLVILIGMTTEDQIEIPQQHLQILMESTCWMFQTLQFHL